MIFYKCLSSNNKWPERLLKKLWKLIHQKEGGHWCILVFRKKLHSWSSNKKVIQKAPFNSSKQLKCVIMLFPYIETGRFEAYFPWRLSFFNFFLGRETEWLCLNEHMDVRNLEDFISSVWSKHVSSILQVCHMFSISWTILHVFVFYSFRARSCWKALNTFATGHVLVCKCWTCHLNVYVAVFDLWNISYTPKQYLLILIWSREKKTLSNKYISYVIDPQAQPILISLSQWIMPLQGMCASFWMARGKRLMCSGV